MLTWLSKHVFFPAWEIKDGARRRQYLENLSKSQWWDTSTLQALQWQHLKDLVEYAFKEVPYYTARYRALGFSGTLRTWEDFWELPLLHKLDIRNSGDALLSGRFKRTELVEARTGGSTGTALTVFFDERCQQQRNAAAMRSDRWAGWDIGMEVAAIWGNPPVADTLKKKPRNLLLDRMIYLDTMNINEAGVREFIDQWRREKPRVLFGHSHSICILARYLQKLGVHDLRPAGIISTSMMLLEPERRFIEAQFGVSATNRYGCEEVGLIACECELHNGLHLNSEHVFVEFLRDDGSHAAPGETANIVVTDLINRAMPLIRYRVGDLGVPSDRRCGCGRGQPLMERVTGRQADFLKRPDGSLVAGVSLVERTLTAIPGIEQMQLVQDALDKVSVKLIPESRFDEGAETALRQELQSVFGAGVEIEISRVDNLERTSAGKYRFAICNV